ncbi:MAG: hypothetical protein JW737_02140 [Acidobacteria bacterium]|nr:hypothetical protein [Acidobacteriota bacterium]
MMMKKKSALQYSMILGGIYDIFFGLFILFIPRILAKIILLDMPLEEAYLRLNGLFLIIIGAFYILYWFKPEGNIILVKIAICARFSGVLFFFAAYFLYGYPFTFLLLGIADGIWGVVHCLLFKSGIKK